MDDVANYDIRPETWCEVTGRGSGVALDGVHHVDTARPYGQMTTFCGVVVSVVVPLCPPKRTTAAGERAGRKQET